MIYRNVWVPSHQRFIKFKELTTIQYKNILKCMDDGFFDMVNDIIISNCKELIDLSKLTMLDRFIILLYLKIYSCGAILEFNSKCENCKTENSHRINLNELLDILGANIDKDFKTNIHISPTFSVILDLPNIEYFDIIVQSNELNIDDYLYMFIHTVRIAGTDFVISLLTDSDKKQILSTIPYTIYADIRAYSESIRKLFSDIKLFNITCSNTKCNKIDDISFTLEAINRTTQYLFLDDNFDNVISFMGGFGEKFHVDYKFYEEMSPLELNLMFNSEKAQSELPPMDEHDNDLFTQYRDQTKTMVETPSEFR